MPDTIVPAPGYMATANMHIGAQLPTCEWARKVAHGQGNILGNYSQMVFTHDDAFQESFTVQEWKELVNHKFVLPHLATYFALSLAARVQFYYVKNFFADPDLRWKVAADLQHNATGESFWAGTATMLASRDDIFAGTRIRFMFDAMEEGVLTSGHMDELWRWRIYLHPPEISPPDDVAIMRTWAHAFYGGFLPLK